MAWNMPPIPDNLKKLLMRQQNPAGAAPGGTPLAGAAPPSPYGPQPTPQTIAQNRQEEGMPVATIQPGRSDLTPGPGVPVYRTALAQPGNPGVPPPSDDPSVSMPRLPQQAADMSKTPDLSSYLNPVMKMENDALAGYNAVPKIDPQQVRPRWWERALGVALGATQIRNPENAGAVADMVVHRRLYGAQRARALALQPYEEQLKAIHEGMPIYTAAAKALYDQAQLGLENRKENREQTAFENETGDKLFQETGSDGQPHYYQLTKSGRKLEVPAPRQMVEDDRKREEDANTPAPGAKPQRRFNPDSKQMEWQVRTKSGAMIPYQFTDVGAAALAGDLKGTALFNREHREPREPRDPNRGTPGQFAGADVKKNQAIQKAHTAFIKATSDLDPNDAKESTRRAFQQAHDDYEEATQDAQNAYEQEVTSLGGAAQHSDTSQWRGSSKAQTSPAAQAGGEKVNELGGRKVGDVGVVRGQRVRITNIYKNGKFDYEPVTAQ